MGTTHEHSAMASEEEAPPPDKKIRSSEGKIILAAVENLADHVAEMDIGLGRLVAETAENTRLLKQIAPRVESMRPKLDSIGSTVDDRISQHDMETELADLRAKRAVFGKLGFEMVKAVLLAITAGAIGVAGTIGYQALLYYAGHHH